MKGKDRSLKFWTPELEAMEKHLAKGRPVDQVQPPSNQDSSFVCILGSGTSTGCPIPGCSCSTCQSSSARNQRTRASILIQHRGKVLLVDTSPDLRLQALREGFTWIDAVLFSHPHADHLHGIDELRTFNFLMRQEIPIYGNSWTIQEIKNKFHYIFKPSQLGGGLPQLIAHEIPSSDELTPQPLLEICGLDVQPLPVIHGKMPVLGYRIGPVAYITDCSSIPDSTLELMKGLDILILDCLRFAPHSTHLNVRQAILYAEKIGARKTYFTHMSHDLDYEIFSKALPEGLEPVYDGLRLPF